MFVQRGFRPLDVSNQILSYHENDDNSLYIYYTFHYLLYRDKEGNNRNIERHHIPYDLFPLLSHQTLFQNQEIIRLTL